MSFSLTASSEQSIPVAKVMKTKDIVYLNPEEPRDLSFYEHKLECPNCKQRFKTITAYRSHLAKKCSVLQEKTQYLSPEHLLFLIPTILRQVIYCAGASGSGKSYCCAMYMNYFHKLFPEKKIIVISVHEDDPTFKLPEFGGINKVITVIKPNLEWLSDKFELEDFSNALVVFDDIMASKWSDNPIPKKAHKEDILISDYIHSLIIDILQNGRHQNIHMFLTSHKLYDGQASSEFIGDCTHIIVFPRTTGPYHMNYFLKHYVGLLGEKIRYLMGLNSRWILISKNSPKYIMWEHGVSRYDL